MWFIASIFKLSCVFLVWIERSLDNLSFILKFYLLIVERGSDRWSLYILFLLSSLLFFLQLSFLSLFPFVSVIPSSFSFSWFFPFYFHLPRTFSLSRSLCLSCSHSALPTGVLLFSFLPLHLQAFGVKPIAAYTWFLSEFVVFVFNFVNLHSCV